MTVLDWVDEPRIIDMHAHQPTAKFLEDIGEEMIRDVADRFGAGVETWSYEEMITEYREHDIGRAVLLGRDAGTNTGNPSVPNDYVVEVRDVYPEFSAGFGSVDPLKDDCAEEAVRYVEDLGSSRFKSQQITQGFDPSDDEHRALFDTIEDLGVPVVFHGGNSTLGAYPPGGHDLKIKYDDPILIDDVAAGRPDLQILIARPAYPWEKEQLAIYQQKGNVYMGLSEWLPKYIDERVFHHAKTVLQDKVMFGTDYSMIRPERQFESFEEHFDASGEVKRKLLWENAERFLEL